MRHSFIIPGPPVGKGRPRFTRIGQHVRTYTPTATTEYERTVAQYARLALGDPTGFPAGPVSVEIWAIAARPQRLRRKAEPDGLIWRQAKPDADNVAKAILDALSPWFRDERVCLLTVRSVYAERSSAPRVEVEVGIVAEAA
jgi:Holliday junction resolvase RusA-like endonuclease